jgi:hypothetical protein
LDIFEHHERLVEQAVDEGETVGDLRCCNPACDLYEVQLEPDEIDVVNGHQLRCSECRQMLEHWHGSTNGSPVATSHCPPIDQGDTGSRSPVPR